MELSGADPLNLVGGILPGAKVPATLSTRIAFVDGVPVAQPPTTEATGR